METTCIFDCINNGIGIGDVKQMNIKDLTLADAEREFTSAAYNKAMVIDQE